MFLKNLHYILYISTKISISLLFKMENNEEGDIDLKDALEEEYDEMVMQRADVMENVGKRVKSTVLNVN